MTLPGHNSFPYVLALVYRRMENRQNHSEMSAHTTPSPISRSHDVGEASLLAITRVGTLLTNNTGKANVKIALNAPR